MTTNKVCGKGKCKFTDEFCASGDCPYDTENVANNVAQRNSQDLTEQWKKGELKPNTYYCKIKDNDYIFRLNYEQGMFFDYFWERMEYDDIEEVLAEVPSFDEWQPFTDPYFKGLTTKEISELAKKSIRLTKQSCEDSDEILKLKALLCLCEAELGLQEKKTPYVEDIIKEINEVLK